MATTRVDGNCQVTDAGLVLIADAIRLQQPLDKTNWSYACYISSDPEPIIITPTIPLVINTNQIGFGEIILRLPIQRVKLNYGGVVFMWTTVVYPHDYTRQIVQFNLTW